MHLTENGYLKLEGLSWFIDFLEFLIIIIFFYKQSSWSRKHELLWDEGFYVLANPSNAFWNNYEKTDSIICLRCGLICF